LVEERGEGGFLKEAHQIWIGERIDWAKEGDEKGLLGRRGRGGDLIVKGEIASGNMTGKRRFDRGRH